MTICGIALVSITILGTMKHNHQELVALSVLEQSSSRMGRMSEDVISQVKG